MTIAARIVTLALIPCATLFAQASEAQKVVKPATQGTSDAKQDELPSFEELKQVVERSFAALPSVQPGDLVTKSQVELVCEDIRLFGWKDFDKTTILRDVLPDTAFLARELRTKQGRKFMQKIAALPQSYDKLDRLSRLPHGRKTVHALINGAGGDELIVYLTTANGGDELGKLLQNTPKGTDFNKPTGQIYTAADFLTRLQAMYEAEVARRQGQ